MAHVVAALLVFLVFSFLHLTIFVNSFQLVSAFTHATWSAFGNAIHTVHFNMPCKEAITFLYSVPMNLCEVARSSVHFFVSLLARKLFSVCSLGSAFVCESPVWMCSSMYRNV